jgi:amino acid adenylation domain-containing protein
VTLDDLVSELGARGIRLRRDGETLKIRGGAEALEPWLVEDLRSHKAALLDLVRAEADEWWSPPARITPGMLPLVELTQAEIDVVVASVPGGASSVQDIYPLAPLQEGILFHHLLSETGDPYLMAVAYGFDSRAGLDAFVRAFQSVVDRHDILRTSVVWEGLREPVQVVWRRTEVPVQEVTLDPAGGDALARLRAHLDLRRLRLDLRKAPLLRGFVAWDAGRSRWLMLMLLHHLIADHATLEVIHGEIDACLSGKTLPAPVPFRGFIAGLRTGMSVAEHEAFFTSMLSDVEAPTAPYGWLRAQGEGRGVAEARLLLDPQLSSRLRKRSRQFGVSAAAVCHLAWAVVLARLTGRDDVVFGTVLFGRMHGGGGQAVGPLINTLPVRLSIGGGVHDGVRAAQSSLAALLRHEHASLVLAQRCSGVAAPVPLFTSLLNFRYSKADAGGGAGLVGAQFLGGEERTNYPLTVSVDDLGADFGLTVQVVDPVDPMCVGEYLRQALLGLVRALDDEPGRPLASLDVLPPDERELILHGWNATAAPWPQDACLHELFQAQAARTPDAVAVVHGDQRLTYAQLDARANGLAHQLRGLGVGPDDRVAVCATRALPTIVALLGVLKAGGAYVPLDPSYPDDRLRFMVADSAPVVVLVDGAAPGWADGRVSVDMTQPLTADAPHVGGVSPDHLAYVIYTSGSTGWPKGVMVEHRNAVASTFARSLAYPAPQRFLLLSSFSFDSSVAGIFGTLSGGGTLVLADTDMARDPRRLATHIVDQNVDSLLCVPSLYQRILDELPDDSPLARVIVAGEACPAALVTASHQRFPQAVLFNEYGPTEATVWSTMHRCTPGEDPVPIGRPIANTRVYVLDHRGEPAPAGVTGELYVAGAGVARGYLNRPELTAERFKTDPFVGGRMYRTGDLARWLPDGILEFAGRTDDQVKLRGYRVEPGEIEARLSSAWGVTECAVTVHRDALVAYYSGEQVSAGSLRAFLANPFPD